MSFVWPKWTGWQVTDISPESQKQGISEKQQKNAEREIGQGARVVKTLTGPWRKSGRKDVGDNFFSSIELAEELLSDGMTYVGTPRSNKPHVPEMMKASRKREERSSLFGYHDQLTLASCVPKQARQFYSFQLYTTTVSQWSRQQARCHSALQRQQKWCGQCGSLGNSIYFEAEDQSQANVSVFQHAWCRGNSGIRCLAGKQSWLESVQRNPTTSHLLDWFWICHGDSTHGRTRHDCCSSSSNKVELHC